MQSKSPFSQTLVAALALVGGVTAASPAQADLQVCNDTKSLVGVSIGYRLDDDWITEGWWRVPATVCTSVIEGKLNARYFYIHAEEADAGGRWRGPVFMCTSNKQFKVQGVQDCFARGYERAGFFEVDTGEQESWQVRLTEADRKDDSEQ
ncbi:MAG: DUF1036 domain-containing protein [Ahrensia sp.]|nr:DUF1036 domain-containing protein [Ahrensia sp.]